ncbi:MAG: hypoxanthine phosphoribosyltransferase [Nitrospirales bacterium]|nr:hypoxanthine phosphoribosyltransferase [Nitrospira sp.]MDR4500202.1 hypoxanthine phosphoribosyltransferase [Nitrospirales bacterium]
MSQLFGKPLITQESMRTRIQDLGREISRDYEHKDLVLIGVLKGAFAFYADLVRAIRLPLTVDFLIVQSRRKQQEASGKVKILTELTEEIADRDVVLVEDIVDSGFTVQFLRKRLAKHKPRSLEVCTLLSKTSRRQVEVSVRYIGFEVADHYIVGYGLDHQQQYRNLPYLAVLDPKNASGV